MKRLALQTLIMWLFATGYVLALEFPALTGRVVDNAGTLSQATVDKLVEQLAAHEQATTNQVVVVTVPSLQETAIEDFGYQLGRHWQIGQKEQDNGVLLLVAPNDRKVRIEVGYGLEGVLTDAMSHLIIQQRIIPAFKRGDMEAGVISGTGAIISVLNNETPADLQRLPAKGFDLGAFAPIALFGTLLLAQFIGAITNRNLAVAALLGTAAGGVMYYVTRIIPIALFFALFVFVWTLGGGRGGGGSGGRSGSSGWSSGGGGFSGGGGSFGGGGASGSW